MSVAEVLGLAFAVVFGPAAWISLRIATGISGFSFEFSEPVLAWDSLE